jgi:uncharacterized protein YjbI with pentapeptide repeats
VIGGLLVFAVTLWLVIKLLPEQLASTGGIKDPSKRAEEIGRTRTAVLASLAGVLAAIGAYYTHRTFELNRQGHELNRQGQITERFTRAVDQLGNPSLDVRLGGIYALERLARESRDDHGPIIEILTAYVRERARQSDQETPSVGNNPPMAKKQVATDVQAALTVLGRRTLAHDPAKPWRVDLAGAHLEGANLAHTHLERAILIDAHLEGANLAGAHLERAKVINGHLEGANLADAHLERAKLLNTHLQEASLLGAHLEEASLVGAHLERASLVGAHLKRASLVNAHLEEANLADAHLGDAKLLSAHLEGASLDSAHLEGASLDDAHLNAANLDSAHLEGASLFGAHLDGASLFGAHLDGASLDAATWSDDTVWPAGFKPGPIQPHVVEDASA